MVTLVSRSGRHLQRYHKGCRLVVGCIPYRYKKDDDEHSAVDGRGNSIEDLEVLIISSPKSSGMLFPRGGWESDESMEEAALRETMEEAGVTGSLEITLGRWSYKGKNNNKDHHGYMFPLLVKQQLDLWPEKNVRQRRWVTASEAREACHREWMKEALDVLVCRLMESSKDEAVSEHITTTL